MTQSAPPTRHKPYVYFGPGTWALIRRRYLDGETARALADVFGCSLATIYRRARLEGWSRHAVAKALDGIAPDARIDRGAAQPDGAEAALEPRVAARRALDQAMRLLLLGQTAKAAEAARVAEVMARTADRLEGRAGAPDPQADDQGALEAVRRRVLALCREEAGD